MNERPDLLKDLVASHDLVISLLPWEMHPTVARACVDQATDMVSGGGRVDESIFLLCTMYYYMFLCLLLMVMLLLLPLFFSLLLLLLYSFNDDIDERSRHCFFSIDYFHPNVLFLSGDCLLPVAPDAGAGQRGGGGRDHHRQRGWKDHPCYDAVIYVLLLLFQVGVDPGIDHMLAMECFDEIHTGGGKVWA